MSMDLDSEGDSGCHNKVVPCCAQKQELPTEHSQKRARAAHYSGQSKWTLSRQKLNNRKRAAQGYLTLSELFRRKAEKDEWQARIDALVAAAARPRPKEQRQCVQEEEEEDSDEIVEITPKEFNSETASGLHNHKRTLEAIATNDRAQPCGLDSITTSCVMEVPLEPIQVEDAGGAKSAESESSDSFERVCMHPIRNLSGSRYRWRAALMPLEESEESSDSCEIPSDESEDNEPECPPGPSETTHHDPSDIQSILKRRLEALRHGNGPDDADLLFALDDTMSHLQDLEGLRAAREDLTMIVGDKKKKMGTILRGRVQDMMGMLGLFLDGDLGYSWRRVSTIVTKSQCHGVSRARLIRHWVLTFVRTRELPHPKHSSTRLTALQDEDISQEIQFELGEKTKNGPIKATDLVEVIANPKIQEQFKHAGIDKPSISERMAHRWLSRLGWRYGKQASGMYIDGHEREDVVQYRSAFVQRFKQYERRFHLWDDNGEELPPPRGFPVPEATGRFRLILITHDESTFFQNDQRKVYWDCEGSSKNPRPKGDGQSLMVSDFLTSEWGRLRDDDSEARVIFKPGKTRDGWFSATDLLAQVDSAIDIFEGITKGRAQGLFLFDNAPGHRKRADDAISARRMVKAPRKGWVHSPGGPCMRCGTLPSGELQSFYFPDDHPTMPGWFKGMEAIIRERGLWPEKGLPAQCQDFKCPTDRTDCCCQRLLFNQLDFAAQKTQLEEFIESRGHLCDFYPKYHCELNFIEQYWGAAKLQYRAASRPSTLRDMEAVVKDCLNNVPLLQIRRFANRSARFITAYNEGLSGAQAAWANKKYHGHRTLPPEWILAARTQDM